MPQEASWLSLRTQRQQYPCPMVLPSRRNQRVLDPLDNLRNAQRPKKAVFAVAARRVICRRSIPGQNRSLSANARIADTCGRSGLVRLVPKVDNTPRHDRSKKRKTASRRSLRILIGYPAIRLLRNQQSPSSNRDSRQESQSPVRP